MEGKEHRNPKGGSNPRKITIVRNGKQYVYWQGRVTIGRDEGTGKQKRKSITGKSKKEVIKAMREAEHEVIQTGTVFDPEKMTLSQWLDIWLSEYCGDKKELTRKHYKAQVEQHIKPALGSVYLTKITTSQIQKFYNNLGKTGRTIKKKDPKSGKIKVSHVPLSTKSIRNIHGILTKALHVAVNVGNLQANPADLVTLPRVEKKEIHPLTDAENKAFIAAAEADEYRFLLQLLPFTGLRESEAIGLTWDCIDFNAGTITVKQQLRKLPKDQGGVSLAPTKNDKTRIIKPSPFVMQLLKQRERQQIEQRLKAGELWEGWQTEKERKTALVFTTLTGSYLSPQTVYNHCRKIFDRIGVEGRCVHDLRHTYAVLSLQNGDDVKIVQGNLGHATAAFTLDVYGHVSERMKDDSAARMQRYIESFILTKEVSSN